MQKVTIITGAQGSGKTRLAWKMALAEAKKIVESSDLLGINEILEAETEVIILDGWHSASPLHTQETFDFCQKPQYTFRPLFARKPITIDRPRIIITSHSISPAQLEQFKTLENFELIEL